MNGCTDVLSNVLYFTYSVKKIHRTSLHIGKIHPNLSTAGEELTYQLLYIPQGKITEVRKNAFPSITLKRVIQMYINILG